MNTAEQIYQKVQAFPELLALEVLDFVEFLKVKNQALMDEELDRKIQIGIEQADAGLVTTLNDDYIENVNQRVAQRLAAKTQENQ